MANRRLIASKHAQHTIAYNLLAARKALLQEKEGAEEIRIEAKGMLAAVQMVDPNSQTWSAPWCALPYAFTIAKESWSCNDKGFQVLGPYYTHDRYLTLTDDQQKEIGEYLALIYWRVQHGFTPQAYLDGFRFTLNLLRAKNVGYYTQESGATSVLFMDRLYSFIPTMKAAGWEA